MLLDPGERQHTNAPPSSRTVLVAVLKRSDTVEQDVAHRLHDKRKLSLQKIYCGLLKLSTNGNINPDRRKRIAISCSLAEALHWSHRMARDGPAHFLRHTNGLDLNSARQS
jgi:hypothetical protein